MVEKVTGTVREVSKAWQWYHGVPVARGAPTSGHYGHSGGYGGEGNPGGSKPGGGHHTIAGVKPGMSPDEREKRVLDHKEGRGAGRKKYEPTKNQERKWAKYSNIEMPTDDEFKARWAKSHHGKTRGWGMGKRNYVLSNMTQTREYQTGLWQGRVDRARGLDYSEERNENTYNLGYYRGFRNYRSDRHGWDRATRARFDEKYTEA